MDVKSQKLTLTLNYRNLLDGGPSNHHTHAQRDVVRHRLGKMAITLYALESATYMTAGLVDASPQAGPALTEMEACMTKSFALRAARKIVDGCTRLLGMRAFVEGHPAAVLKRDLEALELWEGTKDMNDLTIGLMAMSHVAKAKTDDVVRQRDPRRNVILSLRKKLHAAHSIYPRDWEKIKLTLRLRDHVDQKNLKLCANWVERCVIQLAVVTERALVNEGKNAQVVLLSHQSSIHHYSLNNREKWIHIILRSSFVKWTKCDWRRRAL